MDYRSKRVTNLPPYLFSVFQKKKKQLEEQGVDVIDLGIGAPDLPTPPFIVQKLLDESVKPENHRYSNYAGSQEFREAVANFYRRKYGVELNPDEEVLTLVGSKEGIAHLISAVINAGDSVLIPDPGYPVYRSAVSLADGESIYFPLDHQNEYRPNFKSLSQTEIRKAKMIILNYPSNPTAATVNLATFQEAISFAKQHNLALVHDAAYGLVTFGEYEAPSILQVPEAKDIAVEFGSLSKSFNMTGWRIGYIVGSKHLIQSLSLMKSNIDTSQFLPIQKAAAVALQSDLQSVKHNNDIYNNRLSTMLNALKQIGIHVKRPKGTFFIWAPVPIGYTSNEFAEEMLKKAGVIITPGTAFGPSGEGYFRISLSVHTDRLEEAAKRIRQFKGGES
ncbi:LL-diaminopimelate aminotransferase [Salirhabdus salicampi]|uniref:LL-diaminopimelate aminotransferase n=1 Tax=Salirhabdus salicampi TaxID=476102 RepID=UPI0020C3399D|nr:LL-diaminopimelate aminotransferase [Salirhabdus salicampi]MCP8617287.1 LL-diaminopimelate aminotransferase [Salirhabdus salicampi]